MFIKGRALKSGIGQGDNEEGEQKLPPQNGSSGPNSSKRNMVLSHLRERVHDAMSSSTSRFIHKHLQRRHTPKKKQEMENIMEQASINLDEFLAEPSDVIPGAELPPSLLVVGGDHDVFADTPGQNLSPRIAHENSLHEEIEPETLTTSEIEVVPTEQEDLGVLGPGGVLEEAEENGLRYAVIRERGE
ncbi:hypothetical protein DL95DRAFT_461674 [Leptodontidium sp. 2 PMI_412]|nr:hypothetical protein DL95DRAFT_461674 [Leptodontidium sp. 2 PMI_412]